MNGVACKGGTAAIHEVGRSLADVASKIDTFEGWVHTYIQDVCRGGGIKRE